jgi:hypothetical protein
MRTINDAEREVNQWRLKIHEETKGMTAAQRKERLAQIADAAEREYGFLRIAHADAIPRRRATQRDGSFVSSGGFT